MDTLFGNSAYNVINLNDMRIGSQISTKKAKKNFRAYARTNLIVWPYLWRGPRYATACCIRFFESTAYRFDPYSLHSISIIMYNVNCIILF